VTIDSPRLERERERRFRRVPALRVRSHRQALAFVDDVGFCSTFYCFPEGVACLWEAVAGRARPRWPRRSHHDAAIGLTWEMKDALPAAKEVYDGKLLKGRPLLGLPAAEIEGAVRALGARDALIESDVSGWAGRWLVAPAAIRGPRGRSPAGSHGRTRSG
jgi:hypothetical protein